MLKIGFCFSPAYVGYIITDDSKKLHQKEQSMKKNWFELAAVIAMVAVISICLVGCKQDTYEVGSIGVGGDFKTKYNKGEALDLTGLIVFATYYQTGNGVAAGGYGSGDTKTVTGYTTVPEDGTILNEAGTQEVTVRYTEGGITVITIFEVDVSE
jgi:hypothetical protein